MNKLEKQDGFSVIIRSRNEERWIGHSIQSVIENIPCNEIVLVDNKSHDNTLMNALRFQRDPNYNDLDTNYTEINLLNIDEYLPGKALNMGVKNSNYENIIILSSHCILKQIDLKSILSNLESYDGIFGNQIPIYEGKKIKKRYLWNHFKDSQEENMFSDMEQRYFFHNAISCFKKKTLEKNPFNESLSGKEDRYWARDIIESGGKTLYDPEIIVDHHYTPEGNTWKGIG